MFHRILKPILAQSFFLFGARGTGKSTFLRELIPKDQNIWIDLLDPDQEELYNLKPNTLIEQITAVSSPPEWVVIDEVQKVPKLLNLVHQSIEQRSTKFALTGSSAHKLRHGSANLLAGRAFVNYLYPLTRKEMASTFNLDHALHWGTLPKISQLNTNEEKKAFLKSYTQTYLKEEVWAEQIVRKLEPFRKFLEIASQSNSEIINYSNIAKDVGVDTKTVQVYFQILEDTLLGVMLEPYHLSIRKQQRQNPKFYLFDLGVKRAYDRMLDQELVPGTYAYGKAFEHWVIIETFRLNQYLNKDYRFYYLRTKEQAEIDLIVERPGLSPVLVEIKAGRQVDERDTRRLEQFIDDFNNPEAFCLSQDPVPKKIGRVLLLPWEDGLDRLFGVATNTADTKDN